MSNINEQIFTENILQFHAYKNNLFLLIFLSLIFKIKFIQTIVSFSFFIISNLLLFQIKGLFQYSRTMQFQIIKKLQFDTVQ